MGIGLNNIASTLGSRINGRYYLDFNCIEFGVNGGTIINVTEINYSHGMEGGLFRGTSSYALGRTRGDYDADGDFTIYKEDYEKLKLQLSLLAKTQGVGAGYMLGVFGIAVSYRAGEFAPTITDTLEGCRIAKEENGHSQGNDALVVKVSLSVMRILPGGTPPVDIQGAIGGLL